MRQLFKSSFWIVCCLLSATPTLGQSSNEFTWREGQVLPHFATPAKTLDAIDIGSLSRDEQLTFSVLAGHVNRRKPRIALLNRRSEEGRDTWLRTSSVDLHLGDLFDEHSKWELVSKYANEVNGVVAYDAERNNHMRNLACTVAGLRKALPATREVFELLRQHGVALPLVADLTSTELKTGTEVYEYLYKTYWPDCEKRFIVSARPEGRGGSFYCTRDLAAACGAATVWLDCRDAKQRELFGRFLADMPAGDAVVLGWYTSERSGVTTATRFGIGTMPSDNFMNATVFAGGDHAIHVPQTPERPALEKRLYATIFLSDGDNIQYTQHAMRRIWDRSTKVRGQMPLNWTISPGLVDIAPGIMNYYYSTATPNDCFVSGPSGMGYAMPVNTLDEPGAPLGSTLDDEDTMDAYTRLTSRYLQRAGLSVVTIWDNLTSMQRRSFEKHCTTLLGATVQNFRDDPTVESSVVNDRLRFERLELPYVGSYEQLQQSIERTYTRWDGEAPGFVAYQANIWSPLQPETLIQLMSEIERKHPQIKFVRADHYFELQRVARGQVTEARAPKIGSGQPDGS